jgi:NAD(P)H-hydrate epimerase
MQKVIAAAEMRELDRLTAERFATPTLLLMEAAAAAALKALIAHLPKGLARQRVRVLCGRGNNGGDGAALARALWLAGAHAEVVLFGRVAETQGDACTNFEIVRHLAGFNAGSRTTPPPLSFTECESQDAWEEIATSGHSYDIIVDALFGTGLSRPLEGVPLKVVQHLALLREARERAHGDCPLIVALDIPSGLNADSAKPNGEAVRADLTVTFTAPKPANVLPPAAHYNGQLIVAGIGTPLSLLQASRSQLFVTDAVDARRWLMATRYTPDSYKNTHGHALIIAGSRNMTGAAALCANAAMRSGAGLVTIATSASAQNTVASHAMPEIMSAALPETEHGAVSFAAFASTMKLASRAQVIAIGPGLSSDNEETRRFVRAIVTERALPIVLDADALNSLAPWPSDVRGTPHLPIIITPHQGEMLRLLNTEDKAALTDPVEAARAFATTHHLILVLKGTRTLIAAPDGRVFINPTGNAGLGTAGAGDTLTGIITGFNAQAFGLLKNSEAQSQQQQEANALQAATYTNEAIALDAIIAAVYVGGLAGDLAANERGMRTLVASDVRDHFGAAIAALDAEGERP